MSDEFDLSYKLDISELSTLLPADPHPFTKRIVQEAESFNIQLEMAVERRNSEVEKEGYDDYFGVEDKKSKLSAIRSHSLNNFKALENLLDRGVYCPFCFIFRRYEHILIPYSKGRGLLECPEFICESHHFYPPPER